MGKYSIGLDIGTNSVGWAVIDNETNKVVTKKRNYENEKGELKKKKVSLWGSRLFDEASTAEDRRLKRNQRRRYVRRRNRIKLLRSLFNEEINKVDKDFFKKLDESFYKENDIDNKKYKLTDSDKEFIKNYQKKYKTIYHLRYDLMNNNKKFDIRLVYLAIHHIIKYRGNFNYNGKASSFKVDEIKTDNDLKLILKNFKENTDNDLNYDYEDTSFIEKINACFNIKNKKEKNAKIKTILLETCDKQFSTEFANVLSGYKFNITKLFNLDSNEIKISFEDSAIDEEIENTSAILNDNIEILYSLYSLYNKISLKNIFGNYDAKSLSDLKIKIYNIHKVNLKTLKNIFKENKKSFDKLFFSKDCAYVRYVKNNIEYSDFIKEIKKEYSNLSNEGKNKLDEIGEKLDNPDFLPRVTSKQNGQYPYQLNEVELIKIIENQSKYYPFLADKINDTYKIVKILEFKIPYYVGPLNNSTNNKNVKNDNAWLIKNTGMEKISVNPFNFDEVVNKDKTAEKFIKKMISHCTYLPEEDALPNNSIIYCKFKVLNELKQISFNDGVKSTKLDVETVNNIYNNLFLKEKNITKNKFEKFLKNNNIINDIDYKIEGFSSDKGFANSMSSYIDFFGNDGIFNNTNYKIKEAEEIIEWVTIFEDKDILKDKLKKEFNNLDENKINKIIKLNYKGWGNLSLKLINGIKSNIESSNSNKTILELMQTTKENFMQILNNKQYKFLEQIDEINSNNLTKEIDYSIVSELATSPANKRGIWQALKIVKELVDYLGEDNLDSIYLEMARGDEEKNRTTRRKNRLEKFIEENKELFGEENYKKLKDELKDLDEKEITQRIYLYFIQGGKSLYSQRPINLIDIGNKDLYEIDHIIPQSLIKDDSLDNKALVYREENQKKGGSFVLPSQYRNYANIIWWSKLKDAKLISPKKFKSLTRDYLDEKTLEGFINRQIVETRQISIHVANILKNIYGAKKNISFINAGLSHDYRECFELYKYRNLNDYHHAKDAYLAAVLGRYKDKLLGTNDVKIAKISKKILENYKSDDKKIDYSKLNYGFIINNLINATDYETGEIKNEELNELNNTIHNQMYNNDVFVTRKTEIKTGNLFNETKYGAKDKKGSIKLKDNLSLEYGGYSSLNPSYICLVKYESKGEYTQRLVGMPIMYIDTSREKQIKYLKKLLKTEKLEIIKDKIPFNIVLNWDGQICSIVGATDKVEVCNAKEFKFKSNLEYKWRYSLNRLFNKKKQIDDETYSKNLSEIIIYVYKKIEKEYKLYNNLLDDLKRYLCIDDLDNLSFELKENILNEIFNLLHCNSKNANFKFLDKYYPNYKKSSAFGKKNKRIIMNARIINQSVTGIKESYYEF